MSEIPTHIDISNLSLSQLEAWARGGDWDKIDAVIKSIAEVPQFILGAVGRIDDENYDIRDLAASILEATSLELAEGTKRALYERLDGNYEGDGRFASFRAAFALFKHGDRSQVVVDAIRIASVDEDEQVSEIAKGYLAQLEQELLTSN